jgi:hypothetical protein
LFGTQRSDLGVRRLIPPGICLFCTRA